MSRRYHSASSATLGQRCQRAWAYRYLDGIREPDVAWVDVTPDTPSRQRSFSLGKAVHAIGEAYYREDHIDWPSVPGQIFASGLHLLPPPGRDYLFSVEHALGTVDLTHMPSGAPIRALRAHGILWAGYIDLLYSLPQNRESTRVVDYKTSSNIKRWALSSAELHDDLQCCLYCLDTCERVGLEAVEAQWVYLETKKVRRAQAVETCVSVEHALEIIAPYAELAKHLDTIESSATAECNPDACWEYGGCEHHPRQGGSCDVRTSLMASYRRIGTTMDAQLQTKFAALAPAPEPEPAALAPAPEPEPEPAALAPAPKKRVSKKRVASAASATPVVVTPIASSGSVSEELLRLHGELVLAEASVAATLGAIAALVRGTS